MGAMTALNISNNDIGQAARESNYIKKAACDGTSFEVGALVGYQGKQCKVTKAVDSDKELRVMIPADMSGVIALANGIKNIGAMTSLNLASNSINAEGAKHIAGALTVSKYVLAVILVPLSCQSDHYFHCWCLL
jgi:hypothetical protein